MVERAHAAGMRIGCGSRPSLQATGRAFTSVSTLGRPGEAVRSASGSYPRAVQACCPCAALCGSYCSCLSSECGSASCTPLRRTCCPVSDLHPVRHRLAVCAASQVISACLEINCIAEVISPNRHSGVSAALTLDREQKSFHDRDAFCQRIRGIRFSRRKRGRFPRSSRGSMPGEARSSSAG